MQAVLVGVTGPNFTSHPFTGNQTEHGTVWLRAHALETNSIRRHDPADACLANNSVPGAGQLPGKTAAVRRREDRRRTPRHRNEIALRLGHRIIRANADIEWPPTSHGCESKRIEWSRCPGARPSTC